MKKFIVAAIVIIVMCAGIYFFFFMGNTAVETATTQGSSGVRPLDGTNSISILLSNGNTIAIGTMRSGALAMEGKIRVNKNTDDEIQYAAPQDVPIDTAQVMNTLITPKGKTCKLILADGTKIWLNAASEITYPVAFKGKERKVVLRGEAYFEVADNMRQPFVVKTYRDFMKAGTASFNVNCYADERFVKTSLIDGALSVIGYKLEPAEGFENGLIVKTNPLQDIAWKNGYFDFDNKMVEEALLQIARWYDVIIQPDGGVPASTLKGKIKQGVPLNELIGEFDGQNVHFRLDGKTLYVSPVIK